MAHVIRRIVAICGCALLLIPAAADAAYKFVDFTPPGLSSVIRDFKGGWAGGKTAIGGLDRAAGWDIAGGGGYFPLDAPGYDQSAVFGSGGGLLAGSGFTFIGGYQVQAMLWSATTHGFVVMHPTGASISGMYDTDGFHHVGWADFAGARKALLWTNGADDYVDLTPKSPAYNGAVLYAIEGAHQVGYATQFGPSHAMLWSGTAASAVDLNPAGYEFSTAYGVFGNQQVGEASKTGIRAALWNGTAASFVDLSPPGRLGSSGAKGTNGQNQVGYAFVPGSNFPSHAYRWTGTAESALDLHQFLPAGFDSSDAQAIDLAGNIYGNARDLLGNFHAIAWMVVPEPSSIALACLGTIALLFAGLSSRTCSRRA